MATEEGAVGLARTLLGLLAEAPGYADDLAQAIGSPPTAVYRKLEQLTESGKVVRAGGAGVCWYRIAPLQDRAG